MNFVVQYDRRAVGGLTHPMDETETLHYSERPVNLRPITAAPDYGCRCDAAQWGRTIEKAVGDSACRTTPCTPSITLMNAHG